MQSLIGQTLGRYRLDSLLGEGGMGAVYKARDLTLQREVAVKVMHSQFSRRPDFQQRFLKEAQVAAALDHPGIVKVYDFGNDHSLLYIVMEFLPGTDMRKMLQDMRTEGKWIPLNEAVLLMRQVCLAIDYAHRRGVLHRDIKPDNIMLKPEPIEGLPYRPVLTDLGLARLLEGEHLTQQGVSMGTPAYMSPEQAQGLSTDVRSDVYSLGILLYELSIGRLPFSIKTITEAIRFHTKEPPPTPRSIRQDVPVALERIILKALEKEPAARYNSALAMAQVLASLPTETVGVTSGPPLPEGNSLLTVFRKSVIEPRGMSIMGSFPPVLPEENNERVRVLAPDHSVHVTALKSGLTIGRDVSNDIVLDDKDVSRHHARIDLEDAAYKVTDLKSTNGTYIANFKLLPGVGEVWTPEKPLRIGRHYLRLELQAAAQPSGESSMGGTHFTSSPAAGRVGAFVETPELSVAPGGSIALALTVINQATVVDHFGVSVRGIPKEWLPGSVPLVQLLPGDPKEIRLAIQPPHSPDSHAGQYPLTVEVASQDAPDEVAVLHANLNVEAYHQFSTKLVPERIQPGHPAQVTVRNLGNQPEKFDLSWRDEADELAFLPPHQEVTIVGGHESYVAYHAAPRRRRWIGGEKQHTFKVLVTTEAAEAQEDTGQLVSRGLIPSWAPPAALLMSLMLCAFLYALFVKPPVVESVEISPSNPPPNTPVTIRWQATNCQRVELRNGTKTLAADLPCIGEFRVPEGFDSKPNLNVVATNMFALAVGQATKTPDITLGTLTPTPTPKPTPTLTPTPEPGAPVIKKFAVSTTVINFGDSVTIEWEVSNAESVQLKFGDRIDTVADAGSRTDTPAQNRVYTLIANHKFAGKQAVQRSLEVMVTPATATPDAGATSQSQQAAVQATAQAQQAITDARQAAAQATAQSRQATADAMARDAAAQQAAAQATAEAQQAAAQATAQAQQTAAQATANAQKTAAQQTAIARMTLSAVPTPTPVLSVSGVNASVSPGSAASCPTTFNFAAVITVNRAGVITYKWERSDGATAPTQSLTFAGAGSQTVNTSWALSGAYSGWERLRVLTPVSYVSNAPTFSLTCGPTVVYDLIAQASSASWLAGSPSVNLSFNGSDGDERGFALWRNSFLLNDGSRPARVLETHPRWVDNGFIEGAFTAIYYSGYTVQGSDHISGKVGFISGGSAGNVTFRIMIRPVGLNNTWIMSLPLAYSQGVRSFDVSLGSYIGRKADFILQVDAGASSAQDWAVWQDVKILR